MTSSARHRCKNNSRHSQLTNSYSKNILPMLLLSHDNIIFKSFNNSFSCLYKYCLWPTLERTFHFLKHPKMFQEQLSQHLKQQSSQTIAFMFGATSGTEITHFIFNQIITIAWNDLTFTLLFYIIRHWWTACKPDYKSFDTLLCYCS